jgi:hypothetical protein
MTTNFERNLEKKLSDFYFDLHHLSMKLPDCLYIAN